jgi:serine/threonine-protein kinase
MLREIEALPRPGGEDHCREAYPAGETPAGGVFGPLRSRPAKVRPAEARRLFDLDELWRPNRFAPARLQEREDGTVRDQTHGLVWERAGSDYPLTWPEAGDYVRELNRSRFAGRTEWRLPTVAELSSLVTETPRILSYCLARPFDFEKKCLWSADRRSFTAAWFVSIDLGFVFWQDFTCRYFVRAVCSA